MISELYAVCILVSSLHKTKLSTIWKIDRHYYTKIELNQHIKNYMENYLEKRMQNVENRKFSVFM